MTNFRVFPIPSSVALRIRETRLDDFGHHLTISVATENDTGPCRSCLKIFLPGEGRILFSYAPNQFDHPYNEIGPIYIHERDCQPYGEHDAFPLELRTRQPITLRCYASDGMMIDGELVGQRPVEGVIEKMFENPQIKYLHARTASVGCYIARIERAYGRVT
jgi:hypothetical protein